MVNCSVGICPEDYYSKAEIAEYEHMDARTMADLASSTFRILGAKFEEYGCADWRQMAKVFNNVAVGICYDRQINRFYGHGKLAPFAHLFRLFVKRRMAKKGDTAHTSTNVDFYCDFGVKKAWYEEYKRSGKLPNLRNLGASAKHDVGRSRAGRKKVVLPGGGALDIPRNEVLRRFENGIADANSQSDERVTLPEMVLYAMREYMERRPALFDVSGIEVAEDRLRKRDTRVLTVQDVDGELMRWAHEFIQRHNGSGRQPITLRQFVEAALRAHLERMPLELIAPGLAAELRELEGKP